MRTSEYLQRKLQVTLTNDAKEALDRQSSVVSFPAGHTVLWEGDAATHLYYILQGVVRGYYLDSKDNDITKCFCAEDDFFSTEGYRRSSPATFTIECLEDCRCVQLPYPSLKSMVNAHKNISDAVSHFFQAEVSKQENRNKNLMLHNAEERYRLFCTEYPHLHNRVALKHIASYIGVRAASLSRIRNQHKPDQN